MVRLLGAACRLTQLGEHLANSVLPNCRKNLIILILQLDPPTFLVLLVELFVGVMNVELGLLGGAAHGEEEVLALFPVRFGGKEAEVSLHVGEGVQDIRSACQESPHDTAS